LIKETLVLEELGQETNAKIAQVFMQAASAMSLSPEFLTQNMPTMVDTALQSAAPWLFQKKDAKLDLKDVDSMKTFYEKMVASKNKINENRDKHGSS